MLFKSCVNALYLFLCTFIFLIRCDSYCVVSKSLFIIVLYELYIYHYFTSCLGMLDLLIELIISLNRLFIITNRWNFDKMNRKFIFIVISLFSLLFYSPNVYLLTIKQLDEQVNYLHVNASSANRTEPVDTASTKSAAQYLHPPSPNRQRYQLEVFDPKLSYVLDNMLSFGIFLRNCLISAIVIVMNVTSCFHYKDRITSKQALKTCRHGMILIFNDAHITLIWLILFLCE